MSLAAATRDAVRARPSLLYALRAGVVNYTAAAESLDVEGDTDSIATALRRFADDLPPVEIEHREVTVRMRSGVGLAGEDVDADADDDRVLTVGDVDFVASGGGLTALVVTGEVDTRALSVVCDRLDAENILVDAAGVADDELVVVVPQRQGATALRHVESVFESLPV
ncbi:hypothetical protein C499_17844 [Halogeometricum borinquense DSM 11551]|uniref:Uncharacterized protein n=1 Tax=Halogeometricum borinquense (strain ATCC 700274 / DSM 11551 / JCM 10706 / KCTC 4070 / PR3) TaxID=469382 RepID=E4NPL1_HALBP|nr:hypothetical protein [Halogeometricum borinquense]ADQ67681.1 hypothetical protein Hbor_21170 [Halogeometricum borinquense DSM 11551]ELY23638.1 hypothetical protein C499_17844 [Halogeometricum borinquense DSM 11551]